MPISPDHDVVIVSTVRPGVGNISVTTTKSEVAKGTWRVNELIEEEMRRRRVHEVYAWARARAGAVN